MKSEEREQIIAIWKTVVEVQQHFNDISMRIRSMFVTILLALFAAIGFLLNQDLNLEIWDIKIRFSTVMPLFGIFGTFLFYFIDRYWYHQLLVGSVKHAIEIEKKYESELPELSLSISIGKQSPVTPHGILRRLANLLVHHDKFRDTGQLHSDGKIELFYKSVMIVLFLTMIVVACFGGISIDKKVPQDLKDQSTTDTPVSESLPAKPPSSADKTE